MARFTANGGLRLHLHGERSVFGGEPKEPIKFRVCGESYLKNPVRVRGKDRGGWRQGIFRVSTAVKKAGNYKVGETLKREGFDDTDVEEEDEDDEEEDEFDVDELACFRGLVLDVSYRPVNVVCWKRAICLEFMEKDCTIDHVLPISRGGEWKWDNLVTACTRCNTRKGHKSLEEANMKLIKIPKAPKDYDILSIPLTSAAVRMLKLRKGVPDEWRQYLPS